MAEMGPPRIARMQQSAGRLKVLHPHVSGGGIPRAVHAGGESGGGGGGGLARSFNAERAQQSASRSGDPAVTGNFERSPYATWFGHTIGGGELTPKGQADKGDYDVLKTGQAAYASAIAGGAKDTEAAQAAVKAGGVPLLVAMSGHPDNPLANSAAMHSFLRGQGYEGEDGAQQSSYSGVTPQGQQVQYDESGRAVSVQDVPGFRGAPGKSQMINTREGLGRLGPTGDVIPILDASGNRAQAPQSAAELKAGMTGGAQKKPSATTQAMTTELTNINTVLENVNKMRNAADTNRGGAMVTGGLGWGTLNRAIAEKTPLSGPLAEQYNEAYNQLRPALMALTRVPGQNSKTAVAGILDQLPDPSHATMFNLNQVIPSIQMQMRERLGTLVANYAPTADNRPGAYTTAVNLAKVYDAHPDKMQDIMAARAQLQQDPTKLTSDQVHLLKGEADNNHLAYDDWTRVERQAGQRGMINRTDFGKLVAVNPDLGNFPQSEVLPQDSPYRKQVPEDRTQAATQAPTLPAQAPVTSQAPQAPPPQAPMGGQPQAPAQQSPVGARAPGGQQQPEQQQATPGASQGASAPIPPAPSASAPIPPAQQPLAQPAPGQSTGIPPTAGGTQALAPSPAAPPPGGVNPASLQPDQAELDREKEAQELIGQARASAPGM